jgi:transcriptional repressor NrdR
VTDSRAADDGIRRRRQCIACGERFSTYETVQLSTVQIVKRDGRREEFNREKLLSGLRKACAKRNVAVAQIEAAVNDIEAQIAAENAAEIPSTWLGELAMDALRKLDHIAYIRFASVYRPFTDIESLKDAVAALEEGRIATPEQRTLQLPLPDETPAKPRSRQIAGIENRSVSSVSGR